MGIALGWAGWMRRCMAECSGAWLALSGGRTDAAVAACALGHVPGLIGPCGGVAGRECRAL